VSTTLLSVGLLGIVTRLLFLSHQSASVDEVTEVAIASSSKISDVVMAADGFPPLFNLLLRAAIAVSTTIPDGVTQDAAAMSAREVLAGRWLGVAFGIAALFPLFCFARRLVGNQAATLALFMAATSPALIWYSQEGRAYSLFLLLACTALASFYRAVETDETVAWLGFLAACILGSLTHYYFPLLPCLLLVLQGLAPLPRHLATGGAQPSRFSRRMRITFAGFAATLLLPLYLLRADLSHQTQYGDSFSVVFDPMSFGYTYFTFLHGAAIGPSVRRLHSMSGAAAAREFLPWLLLSASFLLIATAGFWLLRTSLRADQTVRNPIVHLLLLAVLPVLAAGSASLLFGVHYKPSYSLWSVAPLLILLAVGIQGLGTLSVGRSLQALGLSLFLVLATLGITNRNLVPDHENEELSELSAYMEAHADPADINLVMTAYVGAHLRRSFRKDWKIYLINNAGCDDERLSRALAEAEEALQQATTRNHRFIYSRPFHGDPCSRFFRAFGQRYDLDLEAIFSGIEVYRINPVGS
jgi:hypothetical protein